LRLSGIIKIAVIYKKMAHVFYYVVCPVFATGAGAAHTIDADNKNIPVNTTSAVNNLFFIIPPLSNIVSVFYVFNLLYW
jgi:hypothetical protein